MYCLLTVSTFTLPSRVLSDICDPLREKGQFKSELCRSKKNILSSLLALYENYTRPYIFSTLCIVLDAWYHDHAKVSPLCRRGTYEIDYMKVAFSRPSNTLSNMLQTVCTNIFMWMHWQDMGAYWLHCRSPIRYARILSSEFWLGTGAKAQNHNVWDG